MYIQQYVTARVKITVNLFSSRNLARKCKLSYLQKDLYLKLDAI